MSQVQAGTLYNPRGVFFSGIGAYISAPLGVSPSSKMVLSVLAEHAGAKPYVWPSVQDIASSIGLACRTVVSALKELVTNNLLLPIGRMYRRVAYAFVWHSALDNKRIPKVAVRTYTKDRLVADMKASTIQHRTGHTYHPHVETTLAIPRTVTSENSAEDSVQNLHTTTTPVVKSLNPVTRNDSSEVKQTRTGSSGQEAGLDIHPQGQTGSKTLRDTIPRLVQQAIAPYPFLQVLREIEVLAVSVGHEQLSEYQTNRLLGCFNASAAPERTLAHCLEALEFGKRRKGNPIAILWHRLIDKKYSPSDKAIQTAKGRLHGYRVA